MAYVEALADRLAAENPGIYQRWTKGRGLYLGRVADPVTGEPNVVDGARDVQVLGRSTATAQMAAEGAGPRPGGVVDARPGPADAESSMTGSTTVHPGTASGDGPAPAHTDPEVVHYPGGRDSTYSSAANALVDPWAATTTPRQVPVAPDEDSPAVERFLAEELADRHIAGERARMISTLISQYQQQPGITYAQAVQQAQHDADIYARTIDREDLIAWFTLQDQRGRLGS